jgi:hypothetical protein
MAAAFAVACLPTPAAAQDAAQDPNPGAMTISGAVDFTNAYMFRGIKQERSGLITWPYFDLGLALYSGDKGLKSVGVNFGTWNSLHTDGTGSDGPSGKLWYESDFYATLGLGFGGGFTLGTTYTAYTSPNNMFSTVKEIAFKASVDDSGYLKKAAVKPYALIAFEFDTAAGTGQADGGAKAGKYVELGVGPGYSTSKASFTVPIKVGLSAGDYYENPLTGEDSKFGYFSLAGVVTVPLGGTTKFGSWNVHGGVEYQRLGDTLKIFNRDADGTPKDNQVIGSVGIGFSY